MTLSHRASLVAGILESVTLLSSSVVAMRHAPFRGRSLTHRQLEALHRLAHTRTPLTPGRLAELLRVTPGAVTQLLEVLLSEGLVTSAPNPTDARSRIIALSADAAGEVADFENGVVDAVQPQFADLSDDELRTLTSLLERVRDAT